MRPAPFSLGSIFPSLPACAAWKLWKEKKRNESLEERNRGWDTGKQRQLAFVVRRLLDNSFCLSRDAPCQSFLGFSTRLNARWEFREGLVLPNWECDTDRAKGLAKLGLKSSAAALIAAAYWALSPGSLAFLIIPRLRQTAVRQSRERKTKAGKEDATVGLGFDMIDLVAGPQCGFWQKQHELWRRTRIKWVYGYARGGRLSQTLHPSRSLHATHDLTCSYSVGCIGSCKCLN